MAIGGIYKNYLRELIIKDFLTQGVIPTKSDVDTKLDEMIKENPNLQTPFTQPEIYRLTESEESSASKINKTFNTVYDDFSVMYRALVEQAQSVTDTYDSVLTELNLIKRKVTELEEESSNLLFLAPESEGSLDFVSDNFRDKSKVDEVHTTTLVDNNVTHVTLLPKTQSRIELNPSNSDVQFNVITRNEYLSDYLAPSSSLVNAFRDLDNIWSHRVEMGRGVGSVTVELIVRVPIAQTEVSKILLTPGSSDEGNIATVSAQYSMDGLNWLEPDGQSQGRLSQETSLMFSPVSASYWKFIFNKAGYDEFSASRYIYEFGAKSIQFFGVEYSSFENELSGVLYSNAMQISDTKKFNTTSLSVCEVLPSNTNISYFVAGLTSSELDDYVQGLIAPSDLSFIPISPLERDNKSNTSVVDFSKVDPETGHSSSYQVNDSINFRYKNRANLLLDYVIPSSVVSSDIRVLRNTGDNTVSVSMSQPVQVNGVDSGWTFDGSRYRTEIFIEEPAGRIIELGDTSAVLNGRAVTGRISVPRGYHVFSTDKQNWRPLDPTSISSVDNPDILYPYNHKYLIEGIGSTLYGDDLTVTVSGVPKRDIIDPEDIYTGVTRYWGRTLEQVTNFDYVENISNNNFGVFTIAQDSSGDNRIAVKHNDEPSLLDNEKFAIITRSTNDELFQAVILKAVLTSQDPKLTPILDEYIIKLGI